MTDSMLLLPAPRQLTLIGGVTVLKDNQLVVLQGQPQALRLIAGQLQQTLQQQAGVHWPIVTGEVPPEQAGLTLSVTPGASGHPQGYELTITPTGIFIVADTAAGVFYGGLTLRQILTQTQGHPPLLRVSDWPDFPHRGVMLDISRNKVPTMETLLKLVDMLAGWKINQLQLYTEHTFAYRRHPEVWAAASPLTGEEILTLDTFCRERFIELVPNQNTFGHMRRWLTHPNYRHLAECPDGCDTGDPEWGYFEEPFSLCPEDPGSLELVCGLMDELLPHFTSRQFNVGCDETVELGGGRSREAVARRGKGRVYLEFLQKIYRQVKARGYTMQFWSDIIMLYPELVPELPRDCLAMEWGYEAHHPFDAHGAKLAASGIPFYLCAGTSSWNSLAGRTENALGNLRSAAQNGLKHGAVGYLITDWGDNGHWQPLPISYLGLVYGAALAWAYQANLPQDVARLTSLYAFGDDSGAVGQLAYDLGNVYRHTDPHLHNNSVLFRLLQETPAQIAARPGLQVEQLQHSLEAIKQAAAGLNAIPANQPLLRQEFGWVVDMLTHACRRGLWALNGAQDDRLRHLLRQEADALITAFSSLWLARNRPGGLPDSLALLEKMKKDYGG